MKKLVLTSAIAGALLATVALNAQAADAKDMKVKCYGVAKAGHNGCKGNNHGCAGQSKKDNDPGEWMTVDSNDMCTKMGGKMQAPEMKK